MFITTQNEIVSLMPTARWERADQLKGWLEEEERVALEPLLGTPLYMFLCEEYERLRKVYVDITSTTISPTHKAKVDPGVPYAAVTDVLDAIDEQDMPGSMPCIPDDEDAEEVPDEDMQCIRLLRICQQIEFYKMLSHKAGLLTVSFNEGGGMNTVSADGYDSADDKRMERVVKDAFMSAGRAIDSLLLFLEGDAKGRRYFTDLWQEANAYYLHKDLLFQTATVLNEYLDIKGERMAYVQLVRDIRFCQNTYLKPRIGGGLLKAVVAYANEGMDGDGSSSSSDRRDAALHGCRDSEVYDELLDMLRTALAFYVESRRQELGPKQEKLARRDSMSDAQQAMATACQYVEDNLDALGDAAKDSPAWKGREEREARAAEKKADAEKAAERYHRAVARQNMKKLFTAFPATKRTTDTK